MIEKIRKLVEERIRVEKEMDPSAVNIIHTDLDGMSRNIPTCLPRNLDGDVFLYNELYKGKFLYNATSGEMLLWSGHSWELDIMDAHYAAVEAVADVYVNEAQRIAEEISNCKDSERAAFLKSYLDACRKRAYQLCGVARRDGVVKFFKRGGKENPMAVKGKLLDADVNLLGCKNGVVDLRTGKFRDGRQHDYISKACPTDFLGLNYPCPHWEAVLKEIFDNDIEIIAYIQRLLGYGITGSVEEHIFPVFQGRGRNGKGLIIEVLNDVLGCLIAPIRSEMLLAQPASKNSAAPSPDIMSLKGLRIATASECDERSAFSAAQVKLLTGGDRLSARNPHDKRQTDFSPTHLLLLLTNDKPRAPGGDYAFWERVHLVEFPFSFVPEPKDKREKLAIKGLAKKVMEERSGILAWLVRGCLQWRVDGGLNPPIKVKMATREYQKDEDLYGAFAEDCCTVDPDAYTLSKILHDAFVLWFREKVGKRVPSQIAFGKQFTKKFDRKKTHGISGYLGVRLRDDIIQIQSEYKPLEK